MYFKFARSVSPRLPAPARAVCLSGGDRAWKYSGGGRSAHVQKTTVDNYTETKTCLIGFQAGVKTGHLSDIEDVSNNGCVFQEGIGQVTSPARRGGKNRQQQGQAASSIVLTSHGISVDTVTWTSYAGWREKHECEVTSYNAYGMSGHRKLYQKL